MVVEVIIFFFDTARDFSKRYDLKLIFRIKRMPSKNLINLYFLSLKGGSSGTCVETRLTHDEPSSTPTGWESRARDIRRWYENLLKTLRVLKSNLMTFLWLVNRTLIFHPTIGRVVVCCTCIIQSVKPKGSCLFMTFRHSLSFFVGIQRMYFVFFKFNIFLSDTTSWVILLGETRDSIQQQVSRKNGISFVVHPTSEHDQKRRTLETLIFFGVKKIKRGPSSLWREGFYSGYFHVWIHACSKFQKKKNDSSSPLPWHSRQGCGRASRLPKGRAVHVDFHWILNNIREHTQESKCTFFRLRRYG